MPRIRGALRRTSLRRRRGPRAPGPAFEQDAFYRLLVENLEDYAVFTTDRDGVINSWNSGAEKLFGYSPEEALGRDAAILFTEEDRAEGVPRIEIRKALERGRAADERWHVRKDGLRFWASGLVFPLRDEARGFVGFIKIARDMTARRLAFQQFQQAQERLNIVANAVPSLLSYVDRDQRYVFCNRAYRDWFGSDFSGKTLREALGEEAYAMVRPHVETALSGRRVRYQLLLPYRAGGSRWIDAQYIPDAAADGQVRGFVVIASDVTAAKEAEERLKRSEKRLTREAEELGRAVEEGSQELRRKVEELEHFSYTLSHDLRAPLRALQGYSQLLLQKLGGQMGPHDAALLQRIADAAARLDRLIRDLVDYTLLGRDESRICAVDLDPVLAHILAHYPALQGARVEVRSPLGRVIGRESLLTVAISNLLVNAVKFVPEGRQAEIEVWTDSGDGRLRLNIQDNGVGVPKDLHEKIFQPFHRLDLLKEGSGIGLAVVRKAVDHMEGTLGLESEPGVGSRFWIELPAA